MCSLSFLPYHGGFHLVMNRDEQRTRPVAHYPSLHRCGELEALYPSEPNGGTWVGVNEAGLTIALLNWYSRTLNVVDTTSIDSLISRGTIIPALLQARNTEQVVPILKSLSLSNMHPFRLMMVDASTSYLCEWMSDGKSLECRVFPWERHHWFSSGYDEAGATLHRDRSVLMAEREADVGSLDWIRRLHRSHQPEKGPYSICMHREDAATVSYSEVSVGSNEAKMRYFSGAPCHDEAMDKATSERGSLCSITLY